MRTHCQLDPHHKPRERSWTPDRNEDSRGNEEVNPGQAEGKQHPPPPQTPGRLLRREDSLSQLGSEAPVSTVVSHQELLKLIQILSSFVNVQKLKKQNKNIHEDKAKTWFPSPAAERL